jgi:Uma2 family endonuclease
VGARTLLELTMPVSEKDYRRLALEDPEGHWELHCGTLRQKPNMTFAHNHLATELFGQFWQQLDRAKYEVRLNMGHVRRSAEHYYIPDIYVIPIDLTHLLRAERVLESYEAPLPLVVEIWSPSTGEYDIDEKLPEYQRRGDLEIWRIHPYDRTLRAWQRQPDGSYVQAEHTNGKIQPFALAGVVIDLDTLFD